MTAEFQLLGTDPSSGARRGRLTLAHGVVETPAFMPVGTYGTVKAMTPEELEGLGAHIVLGNTFHLMLRPGNDVMRAHGGLHGFEEHLQREDAEQRSGVGCCATRLSQDVCVV